MTHPARPTTTGRATTTETTAPKEATMLTLTLLLLTLGALLAAFGVLGFLGNWQAPDHDSLRFVQVVATTGRRLTAAGLALYALHYTASGPALLALLLAAALALATYLTATSNTIVPTGATP